MGVGVVVLTSLALTLQLLSHVEATEVLILKEGA